MQFSVTKERNRAGNGDLEVLTQVKVTNESLWDSSLGVVTKDPRIKSAEVKRAKKKKKSRVEAAWRSGELNRISGLYPLG